MQLVIGFGVCSSLAEKVARVNLLTNHRVKKSKPKLNENQLKTQLIYRSTITFLLALKNDASKASSSSIWFSCSLMY